MKEKIAKEILPDVDYKAATTHKCIRKKPFSGDMPDVCLNATDKFSISLFLHNPWQNCNWEEKKRTDT